MLIQHRYIDRSNKMLNPLGRKKCLRIYHLIKKKRLSSPCHLDRMGGDSDLDPKLHIQNPRSTGFTKFWI